MSWDYRWMLDEEAHAALRALASKVRRSMEREFDFLRDHPFAEPAFVEVGVMGEALFHRMVGDYVIVYHVDHAVRRIFIQQIYRNS